MSRIEIPIAGIVGVHLPPTLALFGLQILPPAVALLLTVAFVVFLFRRDFRERPNVTGALWLPLLWMLISGSRPVTQWLILLDLPITLGSAEEGNPLDALIYFALIAAGFYVLNQRQVSLAKVFQNNGWLIAFLLYCLIAILWSDFPFVAFKRWIKILGLPVMALVLFTEPDFEEALARLMKRAAYVLVPFSILFIKYYPQIGRKFDQWTGLATNCGITQGKNILGCVCMILGFFFFWHLLQTWQADKSKTRRNELRLIGGFLLMISWLFYKSQSVTALICLLVGVLIVALLGLRFVNKRMIALYLLAAVCAIIIADQVFGISAYALELLHKNSTLTDRAVLWAELFKIKTNPIFGVGFESFWLGNRPARIWEAMWWHPDEAHNGYLEIYLDLGLVGLFMLIALIIATFRKIRLELLRNLQWGRFRLALLLAVMLYNWTEVSFRGPHVLWLVFYIIALEYPNSRFTSLESAPDALSREEEEEDMELAYSWDEN